MSKLKQILGRNTTTDVRTFDSN